MTLALDNYYRLERIVKEKETAAAEARGMKKSLLEQLDKKFGCKTKKKGDKQEKMLNARRGMMSAKYLKRKKKFVKQFRSQLEEMKE